MHALFVILNYISVFVMIACVVIVSTHESSRMQKLAMMVCTMLLVCCIGFLIKSEAQTADALIVGQKLVYATVTHGMFLMLLFLLEYCKFSIPKVLRWCFHGINLFLTAAVLTLDHHPLFYVSYWAENAGDHFNLEKDYGPLHTVAVAVFVLYMAMAVWVAVEFSIKNIRKRSRYVWQLLIAVSLPCLAYIIPKVTGTDNELQPIAFALFAVMLIGMVYKSKLYDVNNIAVQYSARSVQHALVVFDKAYGYKGCNEAALRLIPALADAAVDNDIRPVSDTLRQCLDGALTEYESGETIYRVAVRPVHSGGFVIGRVVWFEDVTMERKYTKLLQEQKLDLESRVETLYDISNKDDMTGLCNRRCYETAITSLREKGDLSDVIVAVMDINGLKAANDNVGHKAGDELILGTAELLTRVFGQYGTVYRTGGDEFFVILTASPVGVEAMQAELQKEVEAWRGVLAERLSLACGFVCGKDHPEMNIDELMIAADQTMYRHKDAYYASVGSARRK